MSALPLQSIVNILEFMSMKDVKLVCEQTELKWLIKKQALHRIRKQITLYVKGRLSGCVPISEFVPEPSCLSCIRRFYPISLTMHERQLLSMRYMLLCFNHMFISTTTNCIRNPWVQVSIKSISTRAENAHKFTEKQVASMELLPPMWDVLKKHKPKAGNSVLLNMEHMVKIVEILARDFMQQVHMDESYVQGIIKHIVSYVKIKNFQSQTAMWCDHQLSVFACHLLNKAMVMAMNRTSEQLGKLKWGALIDMISSDCRFHPEDDAIIEGDLFLTIGRLAKNKRESCSLNSG